MSLDRLQIAMGADEKFAFPLAVTLYGALKHLSPGKGADVYVVDGGISTESRRRIEKVAKAANAESSLNFLTPDLRQLDRLPESTIGLMTYLRLFLPDLLHQKMSHVLYLDCDLLIRGDVSTLWDFRDEHPIGAVQEPGCPVVSSSDVLPNWQALGLPPDAPYVNAGVLLMNLTRWRSDNIARSVREHCERYSTINRHADQDGINAILCRDVRLLPPIWNLPSYFESDIVFERLSQQMPQEYVVSRFELIRNARIFHYLGSRKPWRRGLFLASQFEWLSQAAECGWFETHSDYVRFAAPIYADGWIRSTVRWVRRKFPKSKLVT